MSRDCTLEMNITKTSMITVLGQSCDAVLEYMLLRLLFFSQLRLHVYTTNLSDPFPTPRVSKYSAKCIELCIAGNDCRITIWVKCTFNLESLDKSVHCAEKSGQFWLKTSVIATGYLWRAKSWSMTRKLETRRAPILSGTLFVIFCDLWDQQAHQAIHAYQAQSALTINNK